jgi:hypothetical protein
VDGRDPILKSIDVQAAMDEIGLLPAQRALTRMPVNRAGTPSRSWWRRERDGETYLLSEGRLSDDRRVWVVYIVKSYKQSEKTTSPTESSPITPESSYFDPDADLSGARLRAVAFGAQNDGSLLFLDMKATIRSST